MSAAGAATYAMAAFAIGFGWGILWNAVVNLLDRATD